MSTLYKKEKKFFKLTLVLIATEMSLNIKRLQTLTASSVVDCTAYLFHGGGLCAGLGLVQREVGLHIHTPEGWYRDLQMHLNLCIIVSYFWAEKTVIVHDKKNFNMWVKFP